MLLFVVCATSHWQHWYEAKKKQDGENVEFVKCVKTEKHTNNYTHIIIFENMHWFRKKYTS